MKFYVYHADEPTFGMKMEDRPEPVFPEGFRKVAVVNCEGIEDVFRVTNHIHQDWTKNEEVGWHADQVRSTSVGDIVIDENMEMFRCSSFGWKRLDK